MLWCLVVNPVMDSTTHQSLKLACIRNWLASGKAEPIGMHIRSWLCVCRRRSCRRTDTIGRGLEAVRLSCPLGSGPQAFIRAKYEARAWAAGDWPPPEALAEPKQVCTD